MRVFFSEWLAGWLALVTSLAFFHNGFWFHEWKKKLYFVEAALYLIACKKGTFTLVPNSYNFL